MKSKVNSSTRQASLYPLFVLILVCLLVTGWGCSSSRGNSSASNTYTANVGTATAYDFKDKTQRLFTRYQFQVYRFQETADLIFIETEWKLRYPFEDELAHGIEEAKTRIVAEARPRSRMSSGGSELNRVSFYAENLVRFKQSHEWQPVALSDMLKSYLKEFADDLTTEFRTGIRKF